MTSKRKLLKKGKYTPEAVKNSASAPANPEAEKKIVNNAKNARIFVKGKVITYDDAIKKRKEIEERVRARRYNALIKSGLTEEQANEFMENLNIRTIMILPFHDFTIQDGVKKKTITRRDKTHRPCGKEEIEVPNILRGVQAVLKFLKDNAIEVLCSNATAVYFNTTKDKVEEIKTLFANVGRLYIHSWHLKEEKPEKVKKPTNNTAEAKATAKKARKDANKEKAAMRPYYAALRKGGISQRIKKYNKPLAEKIEKWLKEQTASKASRKKGSAEERAKHRQLTSVEMKANKRARKIAKLLATQERCKIAEKKRQQTNEKAKEVRIAAAKKKSPVQTEIKEAA